MGKGSYLNCVKPQVILGILFMNFLFPPTLPLIHAACQRTPLPTLSGAKIYVRNIAELLTAVKKANKLHNVEIWIEDGIYILDKMLWISGNHVTFRSVSGDRDAVVIRGQGMDGDVSHIFNVRGDHFTIADVTIGWVSNHAVQIHHADFSVAHNVHFVDTGEQLFKVSYAPGERSDSGLIEWCLFEFSKGIAPQWYSGGVDILHGHNWIIRHNTFRGIRSPDPTPNRLPNHAIHLWSGAKDSLVENNIILNCDRGIGFGLSDNDHSGGIIRNNFVHTSRDVGIGLENARNARVLNNTVYTENYKNSIEYRFPGTYGGYISNNLTNAAIASRQGGMALVENNITNAQISWFIRVNSSAPDLHLAAPHTGIVDQGRILSEVDIDIDCDSRPQGRAHDIGADEFSGPIDWRKSPLPTVERKKVVTFFNLDFFLEIPQERGNMEILY